jgi:hypothetical protein
MPMLSRTEVGMVIAIWGQAWIRGADGMFRALKLGETLHKGTVVLTAQDAIVQIAAEGTGDDLDPIVAAANKTQPTTDADRAIEGINKGDADAAPAAGLSGGDKVRIAGVDVGEVRSMDIEGDKVRIGYTLNGTTIGTDSRASNPDLSVLADMRFAAKQHPIVSPATLLRMITANAAKALGRFQ